MSRSACRFLCGAAGAIVFLWCNAAASEPDLELLLPNPVIARGKGFEIRKLELEDRVRAYISTLAAAGQAVEPGQKKIIRQSFLDRMILAAILKQRATAEDKKKASEESKRIIEEAKARAGSEEAYRRQLIALGMRPEQFEQRAQEQALVEAVIERELGSNVSVTDEEVREFYEKGIDVKVRELLEKLQKLGDGADPSVRTSLQRQIEQLQQENLARLHRPAIMRIQLIIFFTINRLSREPLPPSIQQEKLQLANKVLKLLEGGAEFEHIARSYSEDPDLPKTGGVYLVSEQTDMPEELKKALRTLPLNQWQLVRTPIGLYVVRVLERHAAGKIPYESAADRIRELLTKQKIEAQLPAYLERLKKEYEVVILPEAFE